MPDLPIGPAYRERLARFVNASVPAPLPTPHPTVTVDAHADGISLSVTVDTKEHTIVALSATGPAGSEALALVTGLAHASVGRGIQDSSEHAVIRLENLLRDPASPRAVSGIVQPENADPAFRLPLSLIRQAYRVYREKTGYKPEWNYADDLPSADWMSASHEERVKRILAAIPDTCAETGIRRDQVHVAGIDLDTRVTLELPAGIDPKIRQKYVTNLEAGVKSGVESRLELYLEDVRDRNTKRHHQLGPKP